MVTIWNSYRVTTIVNIYCVEYFILTYFLKAKI